MDHRVAACGVHASDEKELRASARRGCGPPIAARSILRKKLPAGGERLQLADREAIGFVQSLARKTKRNN